MPASATPLSLQLDQDLLEEKKRHAQRLEATTTERPVTLTENIKCVPLPAPPSLTRAASHVPARWVRLDPLWFGNDFLLVWLECLYRAHPQGVESVGMVVRGLKHTSFHPPRMQASE